MATPGAGSPTSPTSIALAGLQAVGAGLSAYGQYEAGQAGAKINLFNARVAVFQALNAVERGQRNESRLRLAVRGIIGAQRSAFAAAGVDVNTGSAAEIQADTAALGEQDALTIRNNAALEAWGYRTQAEISRYQAKVQKRAATFGVISTILGSGADILGARS